MAHGNGANGRVASCNQLSATKISSRYQRTYICVQIILTMSFVTVKSHSTLSVFRTSSLLALFRSAASGGYYGADSLTQSGRPFSPPPWLAFLILGVFVAIHCPADAYHRRRRTFVATTWCVALGTALSISSNNGRKQPPVAFSRGIGTLVGTFAPPPFAASRSLRAASLSEYSFPRQVPKRYPHVPSLACKLGPTAECTSHLPITLLPGPTPCRCFCLLAFSPPPTPKQFPTLALRRLPPGPSKLDAISRRRRFAIPQNFHQLTTNKQQQDSSALDQKLRSQPPPGLSTSSPFLPFPSRTHFAQPFIAPFSLFVEAFISSRASLVASLRARNPVFDRMRPE